MEDTKLNVILNGNNIPINVINIIDNTENGKKYIIYNADGFDEDFFISILEENENDYLLKEKINEEEYKMVEDYLESMMTEEGN